MAILIDFSNLAIVAIQGQAKHVGEMTPDLARHLVLNSIRAMAHKFKRDYGKIVICCDSKRYWRKEVYPYYKEGRKKQREQSPFDWNLIYDVMDELIPAIKEQFTYKLLRVDRSEADDIIGTLTPRLAAHEPVLIISSDGDFKQLQRYKNVKQYTPMLDVFVTSQDPLTELKLKIIQGDRGDFIGNILSSDTTLLEGVRQKSITAKVKEKYLPLDFDDPTIENYNHIQRNKTLIDLSMTPMDIKEAIVLEYDTPQTGNKTMMMQYMIKNNLNMLLSCLDEF